MSNFTQPGYDARFPDQALSNPSLLVDGTIALYDGEPCLLIRGFNSLSLQLAKTLLVQYKVSGVSSAVIDALVEHIANLTAWQTANPSLVKIPTE